MNLKIIIKKIGLVGLSLVIAFSLFGHTTLSNKIDRLASTTTYKNTYAVIIAVADYQYFPAQPGGDLQYTDDDARKFYQFLCDKSGGNISPNNIKLLINKSATKAVILNTLNNIFAQAKADDRVIFYFSGHGLPGYLIPNDGQSDDTQTFLSFEELKQQLRRCKAKTKLCFIDACNANSIKLGANKPKPKQETKPRKDKKLNIAIMVSSQSYQYSQENSQLKQGVFSYYLINGLKGKADKNKDKTISIAELHSYVYKNVKSYTMETQVPHTFGSFDINMPVVTLK